MSSLLRAFVLAGTFGLCLAAVASAQDIPTSTTFSCPSGKIYIENCNIHDTSDTSTCFVGHPETILPNGIMKYTYETRGTLKKLLPTCQKVAPVRSPATANLPKAPAAPAAPAATAPKNGAPAPLVVSVVDSTGLVAQADILSWLHGNFKLNTSIIVCARGPNQANPGCSSPCKLDDTCMYKSFDKPVMQAGTLQVAIIDSDAKNVMVNTQVNPSNCTEEKPCALPVVDTGVYGKGATISIALTPTTVCQVPPVDVGYTPASGSGVAAAASYQGTMAGQIEQMFEPTKATQVYRSSIVNVQTAMGDDCVEDGQHAALCDWITIHANASVANAYFAQFFYRQAFGQYGQALSIPLRNSDPACGTKGQANPGGHVYVQQKPGLCLNSEASPETPDWIPDARAMPPGAVSAPVTQYNNSSFAAASPLYYGSLFKDSNGDGTTMADEPSFGDADGLSQQYGLTKSLFQARTFVISNGKVLACVDWTLQHAFNAKNPSADAYAPVTITILNPPLTKLPPAFAKAISNYNMPDPIAESLRATGESYMPAAPQTP